MSLIYCNAFKQFGDVEDVYNEFIRLGRELDEIDFSQDNMATQESIVLGTNITYEHPIFKKAGLYTPLGELAEDTSDIVALKIIKVTPKLTKTGKPYKLLKVQCLNDNTQVGLFDWQKNV